MRIAIFANPTISNIMGASDYVEFREACQFITEKYPDAYFYFCLPKRVESRLSDKIDRVSFHFYDDSGFLFYDGQADAPAGFVEMFHSRIGKYPIDAVWTTRTTLGCTLGRRLQDHRLPDGAIPIIIEEYKPVDFSENAQTTKESDVIVNIMSYLVAWNMFDTDHDYELAQKAARRYLAPGCVNEIKKRSTVIYCGINFEFIEEATHGTTKNREFTTLFGGRMNTLKRTDMVFDCMHDFYKLGNEIRTVVCTPTVSKTQAQKLKAEYPNFEFNWEVPKREFLRRASQAHCFVNASTNEGFSVGIVEQLYLGLVGILPNRPWVKGLLMEHFDTYPFIWNSKDEMIAKLKWVHENYEEAQKCLEPIQAMIKERFGRKDASYKTYDFIKHCVDTQSGGVHTRAGGETKTLFLRTLINMPKRFSLTSFLQAVADGSDVMKVSDFESPKKGRPSKWMVYKFLKQQNVRDMVDSPEPWFEKL